MIKSFYFGEPDSDGFYPMYEVGTDRYLGSLSFKSFKVWCSYEI